MRRVLLVGESWISYTTHIKGFDSFYTSNYSSGEKWIKEAIEESGDQVDYIPNHVAGEGFPFTMDELKKYDCVILSDIGANTLLLPDDTFKRGQIKPNRCDLIKDYVMAGGSLLMIGGYLSFSGIDAKGKWGSTSVQEVMPIQIMDVDDRMEHPEGISPKVEYNHPALSEIKGAWPRFLGYNKTEVLTGSAAPVTIDGDPLLAFAERGKGRSAVFTSDCAPHWGPDEFIQWKYYPALWQGIIDWLTKND